MSIVALYSGRSRDGGAMGVQTCVYVPHPHDAATQQRGTFISIHVHRCGHTAPQLRPPTRISHHRPLWRAGAPLLDWWSGMLSPEPPPLPPRARRPHPYAAPASYVAAPGPDHDPHPHSMYVPVLYRPHWITLWCQFDPQRDIWWSMGRLHYSR